jgi:ribosomal protein L29
MEMTELKQLSREALKTLLAEKRKNLQQSRFKISQGKFPKKQIIKECKIVVARILTLLNTGKK